MTRLARSLGLALLAACSSQRVFRYQPSQGEMGAPVVPAPLAVLELEDGRGHRALNHNLKMLALLPLVPFSVSYRDQPERTWIDDSANLNGFVPVLDLSRALAREVEAQRVFAQVRLVEGPRAPERFELRGRLLDAHVSEGYLTYGISVLSLPLHLLGIPEGTVKSGLRLRIELYDHAAGAVLWSTVVGDTATRLTWIYDSAEADHACAQFSAIAGLILPAAVSDLAAALRAAPPSPSAP